MNDSLPVTINELEGHRSFRDFIKRSVRELWIFRYALLNFVSSNLQNRYRRSSLGFLWSLLNPLFSLIILSVVFSLIYRTSIKDFSIYIFSGLIPWQMLSGSILAGCASLIAAEAYLKKVYIPKALFPLMTTTTEIVNFFFSLTSMFILSLFIGARVSWALLALPLAIVILFILATGISLIMSVLTVYFRDLIHIVQVLMTGAFYVTPILYKIEIIPQEYHIFLKLNPFYYFVNLFHLIIYERSFPTWGEWGIALGIALTTLLIGLLILNKKEANIIFRL